MLGASCACARDRKVEHGRILVATPTAADGGPGAVDAHGPQYSTVQYSTVTCHSPGLGHRAQPQDCWYLKVAAACALRAERDGAEEDFMVTDDES